MCLETKGEFGERMVFFSEIWMYWGLLAEMAHLCTVLSIEVYISLKILFFFFLAHIFSIISFIPLCLLASPAQSWKKSFLHIYNVQIIKIAHLCIICDSFVCDCVHCFYHSKWKRVLITVVVVYTSRIEVRRIWKKGKEFESVAIFYVTLHKCYNHDFLCMYNSWLWWCVVQ